MNEEMDFVHGRQPPKRELRRWANPVHRAPKYTVRPYQGGYVVAEESAGVTRDLAWYASYREADEKRAKLCGG